MEEMMNDINDVVITKEELSNIITPENTVFEVFHADGDNEIYYKKWNRITPENYNKILNLLLVLFRERFGLIEGVNIGKISKKGELVPIGKNKLHFVVGTNTAMTRISRFVQQNNEKPVATVKGYNINGEKYLLLYDHGDCFAYLSLIRPNQELRFYKTGNTFLPPSGSGMDGLRIEFSKPGDDNDLESAEITKAYEIKEYGNGKVEQRYEVKEIFCDK